MRRSQPISIEGFIGRLPANALLSIADGLDIGEKGERGTTIRLGRILARHEGQIIEGFRVSKAGTIKGDQHWRLAST